MFKVLALCQFILVYPLAVFCQEGYTLSGKVIDESTGETLESARILCSFNAVRTNSKGHFSIAARRGINRIRISCNGYDTLDMTISLSSDSHFVFQMKPAVNMLEGGKIRSAKIAKRESSYAKISSAETGRLEIPVADLKKVPAIGGEVDLIKAIQLTPGIKKGTEGAIGMYVRGGGADQNLLLLDDAVIYNAGHLLGFFSIFNSMAVRDMTVYKAGFPAMYGGRLSSVLDIRTREGSMKTYGAEGSVGSIASSLTFQGPLIKNKLSFIVSGRRSYIDRCFRLIGKDMPVFFYDLNGKLSYKITKSDRIFFSTYYGRDILDWNGQIRLKDTAGTWNLLHNLHVVSNSDLGNFTNTLKWNHSGKAASYNVSIVNSSFNYSIDGKIAGNHVFVKSSIKDIGIKTDYLIHTGSLAKLKFGIHSFYRLSKPNILSSAGTISDVQKAQYAPGTGNTEHAVFVQHERNLSRKLYAVYGTRFSTITVNNGKMYSGIEPRVSLRYLKDSSNSFKLSYTRMKQYVHLVSSSSLALPTDLWYPVTEKASPEISDQVNLGYYTDFSKKSLYFSAEVYYKSFRNIIEFREGTSLVLNDNFEKDLLVGKGSAYGTEVFLNMHAGRFSGWAGYTLSWSTRQFDSINNGKTYYSKYDRRHDISLVGNYKIAKKWMISASWVLSTGNPFTARIGQYIVLTPGRNDFTTLPVYSLRNSHRFSAAHRLDLDICYKASIRKKAEIEMHFSLYNTYNRTQPSRVEVVDDGTGNYKFRQKGLFGLIPAISCNFKI